MTQKVSDPINKWANCNSQKDEIEMANKHIDIYNQPH